MVDGRLLTLPKKMLV